MTAERWRQIEQLYHAALEVEAARRSAWLADACGVDGALRQEVESLLDQPGSAFLNTQAALPTIDPAALVTLSPSELVFAPPPQLYSAGTLQPGMLVAGRFRIEAEIAAGGMGVVYRALDEKLKQPRALKVAKYGFAAHLPPEAQTAMRITHRNVCRLFEIHTAETPDGPQDFLSMEFIEGGTL